MANRTLIISLTDGLIVPLPSGTKIIRSIVAVSDGQGTASLVLSPAGSLVTGGINRPSGPQTGVESSSTLVVVPAIIDLGFVSWDVQIPTAEGTAVMVQCVGGNPVGNFTLQLG